MSKALEYIKAALQIAFGVVVLAIILLNFHGLNLASQKFLETASVSKIQLPGVEIDMDAAGVEQALSSVGANYLTVADKSRIQAQIHGLDAKELVRLMYVGQLKDLCEFDFHQPKCATTSRSIMDCATRAWPRSRATSTGLGAGRVSEESCGRKDPG